MLVSNEIRLSISSSFRMAPIRYSEHIFRHPYLLFSIKQLKFRIKITYLEYADS